MLITIHTQLIGRPQTHTDERGTWRSAIFRAPAAGPLPLGPRGLAGDQVADRKNHGSPDQAVCCCPLAHYDAWNVAFAAALDGRRLEPGAVGENWTLAGAAEADVCVGDSFAVGTARVQVSAPRYPCTKQERKVRLPGFLRHVTAMRQTGWYLRVLEPGQVQAGDVLRLESRPQPELSIARLNEHMHGAFEPAFARQLLDVPELAAGWKRIIVHRLKGGLGG
jgi:MOSC domain-containing protein YiiM